MVTAARLPRRSLLTGMALTAAGLRRAAAANDPIRLGMQADLTGALAHDGQWEMRAAKAAVAAINQQGGIAGRPIELTVVDTETSVDIGIRRLQQLIQQNGCDFVIGSGFGGIGVASVPIAKDAQVVYLPLARTDSITTEAANPFLYRFVSNSSMAAHGSAAWMTKTIGKTWGIIIADVAFGHSQRDAFDAALRSAGGTLAQTVALPLNTPDPLPYLLKTDRHVDGLLTALFGPDSVRVYPALMTAGLGKVPKLAVSSTADLFDVLKLGRAVEGLYAFDEVPWVVEDYPNPGLTEAAYKAIGIGANGRATDGGDFVMLPSAVICWEYVHFLKRGLEASGWAGRQDGMKLSNWAAANPTLPNGPEFLRKNLTVRPQDQQAFADAYILQVQSGRMRVVNAVSADSTVYPPPVTIKR